MIAEDYPWLAVECLRRLRELKMDECSALIRKIGKRQNPITFRQKAAKVFEEGLKSRFFPLAFIQRKKVVVIK